MTLPDFNPLLVPPAEIPAALVALSAWQNQLIARLALLPAPTPTPTATAPLLDAGQIADKLGVPKSWIREQSRLGHIPVVKLGRYRRFRLADVEAAIAQRDGSPS